MTTMDDETLRAMLADYATATAKRPPCEAGLDPDACDACIAWTSESLEAGVRLWGKARAPGTITALAAEVLRLRDQAIVDHAAFDRLYAELDRLRAEAAARRHALCDALGLDAHTREYGGDAEVDAAIAALRERAARADSDASGYLADHAAALLDLGAVRDAARAHLAADDALSVARRTDAADVPTAEARALAARDTLAGLVGYVGEVGR